MRLVPWVARPPEHVCSLALQWLFLPVRRPPPWGLLLSWALQYRICCGLSPALGLRVCWCPPRWLGALPRCWQTLLVVSCCSRMNSRCRLFWLSAVHPLWSRLFVVGEAFRARKTRRWQCERDDGIAGSQARSDQAYLLGDIRLRRRHGAVLLPHSWAGAVKLSPAEVLDVLTGGGTRQAINVVWDLRLPVAIATVVVGAALGLAGSWTQ